MRDKGLRSVGVNVRPAPARLLPIDQHCTALERELLNKGKVRIRRYSRISFRARQP
jgi:hypothetical protein